MTSYSQLVSSRNELEELELDENDISDLRIGEAAQGHWVGPMDPTLFLERYLPSLCGPASRDIIRTHQAAVLNTLDQKLKAEPIAHRFPLDIDMLKQWLTSTPLVFKYPNSEDPFCDSGTTENSSFPFERDGLKYRIIIASSLSTLAEDQFLLHCFAVLWCGQRARILRWDRNGVIVTKGFIHSEDDHLAVFLWRYSQTTLEDPIRGYDLTALQPLPSDSSHQTPAQEAARNILAEANKDNHREFRIIKIPDRDTYKEYPFLISHPPKSKSRSPFGRATKPMLAFDIGKNKVVYVKDYWRAAGENTEKEGDIYKILYDARVPYISPFGRGNDVRGHVTLADIVKLEDWAYPTANMEPLRHYRMSLEEIGRPLNTFKSSREFVTAVSGAMEAHDIAFHDANILHRDISSGNILITEAGRGLLIDWDLCLKMNQPEKRPRKRNRTGTYEFLSVLLLKDSCHIQGIIDDEESFLYVLLWIMLQYTPHNLVHRQSDEMELFNELSKSSGCGSVRKELFLLSRHDDLSFRDRPCLDRLIRELCALFSIRYRKPISAYERKMLDTEEAAREFPLNYVACERRLAESSWLVKTMSKHLESRSEWPPADKAFKNPDTVDEGFSM